MGRCTFLLSEVGHPTPFLSGKIGHPPQAAPRTLHCGVPPVEILAANYGFRIVADFARSDGVLILLIDESKTAANGNYRRLVAAAGLWDIRFQSASRVPDWSRG